MSYPLSFSSKETEIQNQAMLGDWQKVDKILNEASSLKELDCLVSRAAYGAAACSGISANWSNDCQKVLLNLYKNYGFTSENIKSGIQGAKLRAKYNTPETPPAPESQMDPLEIAFRKAKVNHKLWARNLQILLTKSKTLLKTEACYLAATAVLLTLLLPRKISF